MLLGSLVSSTEGGMWIMLRLYCLLKALACILGIHFKRWMMNCIAKSCILSVISRLELWRGLSTFRRKEMNETMPTAICHTYCLMNSSRYRLATLGSKQSMSIFNNYDIRGVKKPLPRSKTSIDNSSLPIVKNLHSNQH